MEIIHYFILLQTGSDYNIPVALWLLETHPVNAPMVFVRPTSDMRLRISKHVDHNGKVYMPYLHVWSAVSFQIYSFYTCFLMIVHVITRMSQILLP